MYVLTCGNPSSAIGQLGQRAGAGQLPQAYTQLSILDMVHDVGVRVEFLEPYDPHHMPIEVAFRCAKMFLRLERKELARMPRRERLRHVLMRVGQ